MRGLTGLKWSKNNWKATELACINVKQEKITFKKSLLIKCMTFCQPMAISLETCHQHAHIC